MSRLTVKGWMANLYSEIISSRSSRKSIRIECWINSCVRKKKNIQGKRKKRICSLNSR